MTLENIFFLLSSNYLALKYYFIPNNIQRYFHVHFISFNHVTIIKEVLFLYLPNTLLLSNHHCLKYLDYDSNVHQGFIHNNIQYTLLLSYCFIYPLNLNHETIILMVQYRSLPDT